MKRTAALVAAAALLALAAPASAHWRGTSYSDWTLTPAGAEVRARVSELELTRLRLDPRLTRDYATTAGEVVAARLRLAADGAACTPDSIAARSVGDGWLRVSWRVACAAGERQLASTLLTDVAPGHLHFARVRMAGGETRERVLTVSDPVMDLPAVQASSLGQYVLLGIEHILSGWDHLAFVLALLLLTTNLRELVLIATGFTFAHSLTLGAAVLGLVQTHPAWVEAMIAFTIALAAFEGLWQRAGRRLLLPGALLVLLAVTATRLPVLLTLGLALFTACYFALVARAAQPARIRMAMAVLFGLVHGFGFAGALAPMALPPERLALGLFGFNLGIELGQLAVIALAWPALRLLARRPAWQPWIHEGLAAGLCGMGVFWFVMRSFA